MPVVMIGTNIIYMAAKIYVIMFIGIVKVIHNNYMLPSKIKNAPLINSRDAFIMIYIFNSGQQ